ncbi:hypothetical protein K1I42_10720 [Hydrogenophilus thermoluteolus]|nr:hypothetical protein [Hydrogenophilus thermoluteolus]MBW7657757.1 hypothetical protein [Hydrogenophilus thermoluteolus]
MIRSKQAHPEFPQHRFIHLSSLIALRGEGFFHEAFKLARIVELDIFKKVDEPVSKFFVMPFGEVLRQAANERFIG